MPLSRREEEANTCTKPVSRDASGEHYGSLQPVFCFVLFLINKRNQTTKCDPMYSLKFSRKPMKHTKDTAL